MDYLLDTHVCLWAFGDYSRISSSAKSILEQDDANLFVSQISLLEIAVKLNIGKLVDFKISMQEFTQSITATAIKILPVKTEHIVAYSLFEFDKEHRDPFDRYLVAASYAENIAIITCDDKFKAYSDRIKIIW